MIPIPSTPLARELERLAHHHGACLIGAGVDPVRAFDISAKRASFGYMNRIIVPFVDLAQTQTTSQQDRIGSAIDLELPDFEEYRERFSDPIQKNTWVTFTGSTVKVRMRKTHENAWIIRATDGKADILVSEMGETLKTTWERMEAPFSAPVVYYATALSLTRMLFAMRTSLVDSYGEYRGI